MTLTEIRCIGHQRERDEAFKSWVQTQPEWHCLLHGPGCGPPEPARVRSKGTGGSDYWLLPLCFDAHRDSHDKPAWWYANRVVVAEWCAFLPTLWARYAQEHPDA